MKFLFVIFCFFLFPLMSLAEDSGKSAEELKQSIAAAETKVSHLEKRVQRCAKRNRCPEGLRSQLQVAKTELTSFKQELATQEQETEIAAQNAQARRDARRELRKQKDSLYKEGTFNGVISGVAFALSWKKFANTDTICAKKWAGSCLAVAAMAGMQAVSNYFEAKRLTEEPFTPIGAWGGGPPYTPPELNCPPGLEKVCEFQTKVDKSLDDGVLTPEELGGINEMIGCESCVDVDSNGDLKLTPPPGVNVEKSKNTKLSPDFQKKVNKAFAKLKKANPDLFNEDEEDLEEAPSSDKKLAGRFTGGTGGEGSLAGNTNQKGIKKPNFQRKFKNLFAQFKKRKESPIQPKSVTMGRDQVGATQHNIFLMIHRRYQERRTHKQFIERQKKHSKSSKVLI